MRCQIKALSSARTEVTRQCVGKIKRFQKSISLQAVREGEEREREKSDAFGEGKVITEGSSGFRVAALLSVIVGHTENMRVNTYIFTRTCIYVYIHVRTLITNTHTYTITCHRWIYLNCPPSVVGPVAQSV
jgi:hypothetical protein